MVRHVTPCARSHRALLALAAVAVVAALLPFGSSHDRAFADPTPVVVTASPTSNLTDGQKVSINVKTTADYPVYLATARMCRAGVDYQPSSGSDPDVDASADGPNCPLAGLSSSADPGTVDGNTYQFAPTPEGETFTLRVGVGVVEWNYVNDPQSLTCDQAHPCALVVEIRSGPTDAPPTWTPYVFDLTFVDADPVAGCGGLSSGGLSGAASDAMTDAWVGWTIATCNQQGTKGAWTGMSFGGEGDAVSRFSQGQLDLAYTPTGYSPDAGFATGSRPAVAIPVGIGAVVMGLANGYINGDGRKVPYSDVHLSLDELAGMVSGGQWGVDATALMLENPQLAAGGVFQTDFKVGGPSEVGSTPWLMTRYLHDARPGAWKVPDASGPFGANAGRPRGIDNSFALADPPYTNALDLYTGRPALAKQVDNLAPGPGGVWAVADLTTVDALDMYSVTIDNAAGTPVRAEPQAMADAVAAMTTTPDGMLIADPSSTQGYPLTYVEYVLVPAEPLSDASGACRTDSQALLTKWLTYVTGDGQQNLPDGLQPLPADLQAEAQQKIAEVGATAAATSCQNPTGPGEGGGNGGGGAGTDGSGSASPAATSTATKTSGGSSATSDGSDAVEAANAELATSSSGLPDFLGGTLPSLLLAVGALLAVVGLTAVAARYTSGRGGLVELESEPVRIDAAGITVSRR